MVYGISTNSKFLKLVLQKYWRKKIIRKVAIDLNVPKSTLWNIIIMKYSRIKYKNPNRLKLISSSNKRTMVELCKKVQRNI